MLIERSNQIIEGRNVKLSQTEIQSIVESWDYLEEHYQKWALVAFPEIAAGFLQKYLTRDKAVDEEEKNKE